MEEEDHNVLDDIMGDEIAFDFEDEELAPETSVGQKPRKTPSGSSNTLKALDHSDAKQDGSPLHHLTDTGTGRELPSQTSESKTLGSHRNSSATNAHAHVVETKELLGEGSEAADESRDWTEAADSSASVVEKEGGREADDWPSFSIKGTVKYFIIKSFSMRDVQISQAKGIWATQSRNESKLNDAFEAVDNVLLVFSVNESRHFQGYAKMTSKIGDKYSPVWTQVDGTQSWGGTFRVSWLTVYDLPFGHTLQIRNPLNSNKPVKISRDGQELTAECGNALCQLMDEAAAMDPNYKHKRRTADGSIPESKRSRMPSTDKRMDVSRGRRGPIGPDPYLNMGNMDPYYADMYAGGPPSFSPGMFDRSGMDHYYAGGIDGHAGVARERRESRRSERYTSSRDDSPPHSSWSQASRGKSRSPARERTGKEKPGHRSSSPSGDLLNMTYEDYLARGGYAQGGYAHQGYAGASFPSMYGNGFGFDPYMMGAAAMGSSYGYDPMAYGRVGMAMGAREDGNFSKASSRSKARPTQ